MKIRVSRTPHLPVWMFTKTAANFALSPFYKRKEANTAEAQSGPPSLREAVLAAGIHLGAAVHDTDTRAVDQALAESFTSVTPENALKWGALRKTLSGPYDFTDADSIVAAAGRAFKVQRRPPGGLSRYSDARRAGFQGTATPAGRAFKVQRRPPGGLSRYSDARRAGAQVSPAAISAFMANSVRSRQKPSSSSSVPDLIQLRIAPKNAEARNMT